MNKFIKCNECPFDIINKQDCDYYRKEGCGVANKIIKRIKNKY